MQKTKRFKIMMLMVVNLAILILLAEFCSLRSYAINLGENGEKIATIQKSLAKNGCYSGEINGLFDFRTRKATRKFKKQNNIDDDNDYALLSALGVYSGGYECFCAETEILAKYLKTNGIIGYHNMIEVCEKMVEKAENAPLFSVIVASSESADKLINAKPDSEQYSAAFHVINKYKNN